MGHTDTPSTHPGATDEALDKINLRAISPLKALATGTLMLLGMAWVMFMMFGQRVEPQPPPDPLAVEAAFADTVASVLEAARPDGEPMLLPESIHSTGGLMLPQPTNLRSVVPR